MKCLAGPVLSAAECSEKTRTLEPALSAFWTGICSCSIVDSSQVAHYQAAGFFYETINAVGCKNFGIAKHRRMCQRLNRGHADEGGKIEITDIDLIAMRFEIASNQCITLSDISLDIFEPPDTRDLFRKDAMQLGIDAVTVDRKRNELARRGLDRERSCLDQGVASHLRNLFRMAIDNRRYQRLLAREVLVQRPDTDASHLGNPVSARSVIALFH